MSTLVRSAVAVGLAARVLHGPQALGDDQAIKSSGRLAAWLGGGEFPSALPLDWAEASEAVLRRRLRAG